VTAPDSTGSASAGKSALSWETTLSTYLPAAIFALGAGIAIPAVPTLATSFDVSFSTASGVVTAYLVGNLVGTLPSGYLIDRLGRRSVLIGGPLITIVSALLVAVVPSFTVLLLLRFLDGCAAQMWLMGRMAAISHNASPNQRGRQVAWMFGMNNTGKLAGPLIGGLVTSAWGPRASFVVYAALAAVALIPTIALAEDTPRLSKEERLAHKRSGPSRITLRELVRPRLAYFGVALFAGLTRGPVSADLLHLYAAFAYGLGPRGIGYLATSAALITLPIGFAAGWMMDRYGRKRTMVPGFSGVALSMALLAVCAYAHWSLATYVVLFLLGVALQALTGGSVQTIGADVAPPGARGRFLGIWRFTGQGGQSLSPLLFAALAGVLGYGTAFLYISLSSAVVAFLVIRFIPETRQEQEMMEAEAAPGTLRT
jgi:MFS family permease